jgi:hypothetical protein
MLYDFDKDFIWKTEEQRKFLLMFHRDAAP